MTANEHADSADPVEKLRARVYDRSVLTPEMERIRDEYDGAIIFLAAISISFFLTSFISFFMTL